MFLFFGTVEAGFEDVGVAVTHADVGQPAHPVTATEAAKGLVVLELAEDLPEIDAKGLAVQQGDLQPAGVIAFAVLDIAHLLRVCPSTSLMMLWVPAGRVLEEQAVSITQTIRLRAQWPMAVSRRCSLRIAWTWQASPATGDARVRLLFVAFAQGIEVRRQLVGGLGIVDDRRCSAAQLRRAAPALPRMTAHGQGQVHVKVLPGGQQQGGGGTATGRAPDYLRVGGTRTDGLAADPQPALFGAAGTAEQFQFGAIGIRLQPRAHRQALGAAFTTVADASSSGTTRSGSKTITCCGHTRAQAPHPAHRF